MEEGEGEGEGDRQGHTHREIRPCQVQWATENNSKIKILIIQTINEDKNVTRRRNPKII